MVGKLRRRAGHLTSTSSATGSSADSHGADSAVAPKKSERTTHRTPPQTHYKSKIAAVGKPERNLLPRSCTAIEKSCTNGSHNTETPCRPTDPKKMCDMYLNKKKRLGPMIGEGNNSALRVIQSMAISWIHPYNASPWGYRYETDLWAHIDTPRRLYNFDTCKHGDSNNTLRIQQFCTTPGNEDTRINGTHHTVSPIARPKVDTIVHQPERQKQAPRTGTPVLSQRYPLHTLRQITSILTPSTCRLYTHLSRKVFHRKKTPTARQMFEHIQRALHTLSQLAAPLSQALHILLAAQAGIAIDDEARHTTHLTRQPDETTR